MPSGVLTSVSQVRPFAYGPATLYAIISAAAVANGTSAALNIAVADRFLHVVYAQMRSSVAGEIRLNDTIGFSLGCLTVAVNTWTPLDFGALGVTSRAVNNDLRMFNNTGAAANLDICIGYSTV